MDIQCRICFDGEDRELGKLFRPCLCKGTQAYIHEGCLEMWRKNANNRINFYQCPTCKYNYRISRVWFAHLLINPVFVMCLTGISITVSVIIVAWFIRFFAMAFLGLTLTKNAFALSRKVVWISVLAIGVWTMLITLFKVREAGDDIANLLVDIADNIESNDFITLAGYGFSLVGFGIFIKKVYELIEQKMYLQMKRLGERIIEVQ